MSSMRKGVVSCLLPCNKLPQISGVKQYPFLYLLVSVSRGLSTSLAKSYTLCLTRLRSGARTAFSSGGLTGEESVSKSLLPVDRVHFLWLYDRGLQFLPAVTQGSPPLLEATCRFWPWWVPRWGHLTLVTCFFGANHRESLTLRESPHPLYKPPLIKPGFPRKTCPLSSWKPTDLEP